MMASLFRGEWNGSDPLPSMFHELARKVYESNDYWIPESRAIVDYMFSHHNAYFSKGSVWLDVSESARVAGFFSPFQLIDGKKAAFFGYWETLDNLDVNQSMFSGFEKWAEKKGAEIIYGPINFSTYGMYRLRTDSFETSQFIGEPFNLAYYPEIMDKLGYVEAKKYATSNMRDLPAFNVEHEKTIALLEPELAELFKVKHVTRDYWLENIDQLYHLSIEIFKNNFAYQPVSLSDFKRLCGESFAAKICEHSSLVAESNSGEIAGMVLNFPDYSQLVNQKRNLHDLAPDMVEFKTHFELLKDPVLLVKTAGVLAKYRGKHLYTYLFSKSLLSAAKYYNDALGCLFILDNPSRKASDRITGDLRHYALFCKEL